jgi:hypothetical protein
MEADIDALDEAQLKSEEARRIFEASEKAEPWMDDYFKLRREGWSWRQACYMIWAALPAASRWPKTQQELATEVLGLSSDRAIRNWRANNPAMETRIAQLAASALGKARAEIYAALIEAASNPNPRAHADRKLALEMMGDYIPKQRVDVGAVLADDLSEVDTEDLIALAAPGGVDDDDDE